MAIRSLKDINDAVDSGRCHTQRAVKNFGSAGDWRWFDWSYASGQPAFDARIGSALEFTPCIASKNDAVYFPPVEVGMDRRLLGFDYYTQGNAAGQIRVQSQICDLVGYYPLIDGDSTDLQELGNTLSLPRYTSGDGVYPILVNHVAPAIAAASVEVTYTNAAGVSGQTVIWTTHISLTGSVGSGLLQGGDLIARLIAGDTGMRSIEAVRFITPPGGLWCIYLVKPYTTSANRGGGFLGLTVYDEKPLTTLDSWRLPKVEDGAWLTMFYMTTGSSRSTLLFANFHFIWG